MKFKVKLNLSVSGTGVKAEHESTVQEFNNGLAVTIRKINLHPPSPNAMKNKKAAFKKGFFSQFLGFDSEIWLKNKFLKSCLKQKHQLHLIFKKEQWIEYNQCIISIDFITSLFQVEANIVFHTLMPHLNYVLKKLNIQYIKHFKFFWWNLACFSKSIVWITVEWNVPRII